jgi:curved DNA-binding protein
MQNFRNYYEILGVSRDTPNDEIKRVYRQLARRYHPDVNQGNLEAENRFKEINEAYEVLFDPERRAQYDKYGSFWKQQGFQAGQKKPWGWNGGAEATPAEPDDLNFGQFRDFNSFVDELLSRRNAPGSGNADWLDNPSPGRRQPPAPSRMGSSPIEDESFVYEAPDRSAQRDDWESDRPKVRRDDWGGSDPAAANRSEPDDQRDSRRQEFTARPRPEANRDDPSRDPARRDPDRREPSRDATRQPRPNANPSYRQSDQPLPKDIEANLTVPLEKAYSGGRERIRLEDGRMLEVNLPKAIVSGQRVRLRGQGINGGDLYLQIEVAPHKFYQLNGLNLMTQVPVTPAEAVLNEPIEVPTLDGLVKMNLPKGFKSGQKLRLSNKGYPSPNGDQRGDQIVELVIQLPKDPSPAETELYSKLKQAETNPRSGLA